MDSYIYHFSTVVDWLVIKRKELINDHSRLYYFTFIRRVQTEWYSWKLVHILVAHHYTFSIRVVPWFRLINLSEVLLFNNVRLHLFTDAILLYITWLVKFNLKINPPSIIIFLSNLVAQKGESISISKRKKSSNYSVHLIRCEYIGKITFEWYWKKKLYYDCVENFIRHIIEI